MMTRKRTENDLNRYKTAFKEAEAETEVKKSRFIAKLFHVASEEEAEELIKRVKKEHYSASHTCSAYILSSDGGLRHSSDDGEPSGTAGKPILDVLSGEGLSDTLVTVTRYFGGTLLGTGGLVRAYSGAAKAVIQAAETVLISDCEIYHIEADYPVLPKILHICAELNIYVHETEYFDKVKITLLIEEESKGRFFKELTEATSGGITKESVDTGEKARYYIEGERAVIL